MTNKITQAISRTYGRALNTAKSYYGPMLDLSRWNGAIDFDLMWTRGVRLLVLRLSVGDYYKDVEFDNYYAAARAKGFLIGAYHVTKPSLPIMTQWEKIVTSLGNRTLDIPLTLDNELDDGRSPSQVSDVIEGLTAQWYGTFETYPSQYTRGLWWNQRTVSRPIFGKCPLWIARYTNLPHPWSDDLTLKPRDWNDWDLWQYIADGNGQGAYYGVESDDVDLDRANYATLEATVTALNRIAPEPPPNGEPLLKYKTLKTYNIRADPSSGSVDCGDIPMNTVITALDIVFTPFGGWVQIPSETPGINKPSPSGKYWIAGMYSGQGQFLERIA